MPRFAANLTMLFTEYPVVERFDRAAAAGFRAVEFLFPYREDVRSIQDALTRTGLELILFNLPAGDFAAGDRGIANNPSRVAEFRDGVARALDLAATLDCRRFNCLVGRTLADVDLSVQLATAAENLSFAAEQTAAAGIRLGVEPLNPVDVPGFLLPTSATALALIERINHPNLTLQYDVYHAQRIEGNLTATFTTNIQKIGHVQIADSPDRHQPGTGEINFPFVLSALDGAGYGGWVSLEYAPLGPTEDSFGWLREWGYW